MENDKLDVLYTLERVEIIAGGMRTLASDKLLAEWENVLVAAEKIIRDYAATLRQQGEHIYARALEQIKHSVQQARIPGNDVRRELALIAHTVDAALTQNKQAEQPAVAVSDEVVTAAARVLCAYESRECNVDKDDNWNLYAEDFKAQARPVVEAVAPLLQSHTQGDAEPTQEMLIAARDWSHGKYGKPIGDDAARGCWNAMHAAQYAHPERAKVPEGMVLVPRWKLERAAAILESHDEGHGVATDLRYLLAAPSPPAQEKEHE